MPGLIEESEQMAMVEWRVQGREFANCNCAYGCPCQFNSLPTYGSCEAINGFQIDKGNFGDVNLDGLRSIALYKWPGPVHLGNGTMQLIIDDRADARQRDALIRIMSGQETNDMATMWWVYNAMCPNKLEPVFKSIRLEMDFKARTAQLVVAGMIESSGEPIRNAVTGAEHAVNINLPHGFEYRVAEVASGTTKATGKIPLDLKQSHAHFANINLNQNGVQDEAAA
jgi:hypothetical protein